MLALAANQFASSGLLLKTFSFSKKKIVLSFVSKKVIPSGIKWSLIELKTIKCLIVTLKRLFLDTFRVANEVLSFYFQGKNGFGKVFLDEADDIPNSIDTVLKNSHVYFIGMIRSEIDFILQSKHISLVQLLRMSLWFWKILSGFQS